MSRSFDFQQVADFLSEHCQQQVRIKAAVPIGGGSISHAYRLQTSTGTFFLKKNDIPAAAAMFAAEEQGLNVLRQHTPLTIPAVVGRHDGDTPWLLLAYIDSAPQQNDYWQQLAEGLATLHRHTATRYGLESDNFIGSLPQQNHPVERWDDFFSQYRIAPMLRMARNAGLVDRQFVQRFEAALPAITGLMPDEPPALLHGDLWSGNLMTDSQGAPCLIDPAVYYGHREMELAFTRLFGGFSGTFYQAYQECYPLEPGFNDRADLYNLYPLLVHLNLFGRSYLGQIEVILERFY